MTEPFKLSPVLLDYIWGGEKLKKYWNKTGGPAKVAESWELSAYPGKESIIATGIHASQNFSAYLAAHPEALGQKAEGRRGFPILVKLIDATGDLSIQVHPGDGYAMEHENQPGKTEMWYIADAEPGACIYYGFNRDVTEEELRRAINENTLCSLLNKIPVKAGDTYFVEAGTVHALLAGITVIEIQQNSGITYRLYDYGRKGADGKPRELHIEKALAVLDRSKKELPLQSCGADNYKDYKIRKLAECPYFVAREINIDGIYPIYHASSFVTFTVIEGQGTLFDGTGIIKGDTVFVPAGCDTSINGKISIIETSL